MDENKNMEMRDISRLLEESRAAAARAEKGGAEDASPPRRQHPGKAWGRVLKL